MPSEPPADDHRGQDNVVRLGRDIQFRIAADLRELYRSFVEQEPPAFLMDLVRAVPDERR